MTEVNDGVAQTDPMIGRVLDARYTVTQRLGEGGMSVVYRAEQTRGAPVAIKFLQRALGDDPTLRERFEREARALFGLTHPNILEVYDFGVVDGAPYLVMELLEGIRLDALVENGPIRPVLALDIAKQILRGLAFAHAQGALHRDLKPENIFIRRDPSGRPVVKLLDFGLVKFVDDNRWGSGGMVTVQGDVFGTPAYMSPEQATGAPLDMRADVYSAGVLLFELLTGTWPFMEETRQDMFRAHLATPVPSLASRRSDVTFPPELEALVQRAMAKRAADRFAHAGEMLAALEALPKPGSQASPRPQARPAARPSASRIVLLMLLAIAFGVGVAFALLQVMH